MKINEDAPVNAVGGGAIAGAGIGSQGEPGVSRKHNAKLATVKRKSFKEFFRDRSSS